MYKGLYLLVQSGFFDESDQVGKVDWTLTDRFKKAIGIKVMLLSHIPDKLDSW